MPLVGKILFYAVATAIALFLIVFPEPVTTATGLAMIGFMYGPMAFKALGIK